MLLKFEKKCITGDGQGDALAELCDFSFSSGNSTEFIRIFLALNSNRRLWWTGLDGAVKDKE